MKVLLLGVILACHPFRAEAEVHIYGDSIFATSWHQFGKELARLTKQKVLDHSVQGSWAAQVKDQYLGARALSRSTVVFDGGGNDILGNSWSCRNTPQEHCKEIVHRAVVTVGQMLDLMKEDGVSKAVFLGPHYTRKGNAGYEKITDYAYLKLKDLCEDRLNCYFVDVRTLLRDEDLEWDGIHPNVQGANKLAEAVYRSYLKF